MKNVEMEQQMDTELVLSPLMLAGVTRRVLIHFFEMTSSGSVAKQSNNVRMNIELLEADDSYIVRVTNCGRWADNNIQLLNSAFRPLSEKGLLPDNTVIARVYTRTAGSDCEMAHEVQIAQMFWTIEVEEITNDAMHFPRLLEYLSIEIKYKLSPPKLEEFKTLLTTELVDLRQSYSSVKMIFHSGRKIFYSSYGSWDADLRNCQLLSSALVAVIRQSLNGEFRKCCLDILSVDNTHDAQKTILEKLLLLINGDYIISVEEPVSRVDDNVNSVNVSRPNVTM